MEDTNFEGPTLIEIYNSLLNINKELEHCYKSLNYIKPREGDTRLVSITSLQSTLAAVAMIVHSLHSLAERHDDYQLMLLIGNNREPLTKSLNIIADFLRLGLLTVFQFRVESFLFSLIFTKEKRQKKYSKLKPILKKVFPKEQDREVILALSFIRNSLHCNGIHTDEDEIFNIKHRRYEFKYNQMVLCAGWVDIIHLLDLETKLLINLVNSQEIKECYIHIPDVSIA